MKTATEVGGDYYDFDLDEDGTLTFAIGDATGHGVEAGTMVTAIKSLFMVFAREQDLRRVMQQASQALRRMRLPKLYMALALGKLRGRELELIGAGMPPALIWRAQAGCVEAVSLKGMPLGSGFAYPYAVHRVVLSPGDTVLLMSDGLPELRGASGEMLGYEAMGGLLSEASAGGTAEGVIARLVEAAQAWGDGQAPGDDMTFIVIKAKAP